MSLTSKPMPKKYLAVVVTLAALSSCALRPTPEPEAVLHVPSPQWSEQIIYFVMTDRFNDGDPSNNDQGAGEFNPEDHRRYSGGDIKGIEQQLDYIQGLGATAVWLTPPVANQWFDEVVDYGGYHGYWARNFKEVDEHYGTLEDYKDLSKALHGRGMYLVQDIVVNHTGNYSYYSDEKYNVNNVCENFNLNDTTAPTKAPTQGPLALNDACNEEHRNAAIYNFTPSITDYNDESQLGTFQLSNLDDMNTENPVVRSLLKDSYRYWIKEVGVDAFRVDTAKYVSHDFFNDFFHSDDGIMAIAKETGRDDFFAFGEVWNYATPFDDSADKYLATYLGTEQKPELPAVINFPLQGTMRDVFATGYPTAQLTHRINTALNVYPDPTRVPTFLDNHDMDRFIKTGTPTSFRQALTAMMTLPGIPVIYQGSGQLFVNQRDAMFASGHGSDGVDHFDTQSETYQFIAQLAELRKNNPVFTQGDVAIVADNRERAGIFGYTRSFKKDKVLVLFNTASHDLLSSGLDLGLAPNLKMDLLLSTHDVNAHYQLDGQGKLAIALPANSALVLNIAGKPSKEGLDRGFSSFGFLASKPLKLDQSFKGKITNPAITELKIVIDGNLEKALPVEISESGTTFTATLPIEYFPAGETEHTYSVYSPQLATATPTLAFKTSVEVSAEETISQVSDPIGDDTGSIYPTDITFAERQMDIAHVMVARSDLYLDVTITPKAITKHWSPSNQFDHVRYHLMFDLPNMDYNATDIPFVQATMPTGMSWDLMAAIDGWSNAVYTAKDSGPLAFGTAASPAPSIKVDAAAGTIKFRFDASLFGKTKNIVGGKLYVTTWDYDGTGGLYRAILPDGGKYSMQGDDPSAPYIMDEAILTIQ